jgi:hypothetical protein
VQSAARDSAADTGAVLLTPSDVARIDTVAHALQEIVAAHTELDAKKVNHADPYYIAKMPRLAAVVQKAGWTPMQYYRMFSSWLSAIEKCMFAAFGLPQGNTIADKNVRLVCGGVSSALSPGHTGSVKKPDRTDGAMSELTLTPGHGPLTEQLRTVAQHAWSTAHIPIVDVGAPWCVACHTLDKFLHSADMQQAMQRVQLIHLNFDFWAESLDSLGVAASDSAVPVLFVIDSAGRPGAHLRGMDEEQVRHFIDAAHMKFGSCQHYE